MSGNSDLGSDGSGVESFWYHWAADSLNLAPKRISSPRRQHFAKEPSLCAKVLYLHKDLSFLNQKAVFA